MGVTIDAHSHYISQKFLARLESSGGRYETPVQRSPDGQLFVVTPERPYGPIGPGFHDIDIREAFLDRHGFARQVLVAPPFAFYYWIDAQTAIEPITLVNDTVAELCRANPRFIGFGTVPMQDVPLAIKECERLVTLGLPGIEIGSNINGVALDAPLFLPFFEAIEHMGLAVLIHPNNVLGKSRMPDYHLKNLIGFPSDTTLAAAKLIFSGVMERFPRLRICLGQAGGFLPYIIGRLDHGYEVRAECRAHIPRPPSTYLRQFYFDSLIFEPRSFDLLVSAAGADRVMIGSDFPFDMGTKSPLSILSKGMHLSGSEEAAIRSKTALSFLGIG